MTNFTYKDIKLEKERPEYINFEIQIVEKGEDSNSKNSIFILDELFNLFRDCFQKSNFSFDYFGISRFKEPELTKLIVELDSRSFEFKKIKNHNSFIKFIENVCADKMISNVKRKGNKVVSYHVSICSFLYEVDCSEKNWKSVLANLIKVNIDLIDFVTKCQKNKKELVVFGL